MPRPDPPDPPTREPHSAPIVARTADPSVPSVRIDGFDELQPIGRGGFSYVFSARQRDFNRRVALKVLSFGLADERERRSFERECRAMGLVSQHPHIVTVFNAAFTTTKQPCIVMELYSGGRSANGRSATVGSPWPTVLDVGVKIAGALQTAHDRGLLHRDIKPQNLFISEFGEPALGDFGISTLDDERSISGGGGLTVHYAPPEVLEGAPATPMLRRLLVRRHAVHAARGQPARSPPPAGQRQSVGELARRIMLEDAAAAAPRRRAPLAVRAAGAHDVEATRGAPAVGGRVRPGAAAGAGRARAGDDAAAAGDAGRRRGPVRQAATPPGRRRASRRPRPPRRRRRRPPVLDAPPARPPPAAVVEIRSVGADGPDDDDDEQTATRTPSPSPGAPRRRPSRTTAARRRTRRGASCSARSPPSSACSPWPCRCCSSAATDGRRRRTHDGARRQPGRRHPPAGARRTSPSPRPPAENQVVVAWQAVGDGSVEMRYQVAARDDRHAAADARPTCR